jgi:hypothetical protein
MKCRIGDDVVDSGIAQLREVGLTPGEFKTVCEEIGVKRALAEVAGKVLPAEGAQLIHRQVLLQAIASTLEKGENMLA